MIKQVIIHNEKIEIKLKLDLNEFVNTAEKEKNSIKPALQSKRQHRF